MSPRRLSLGCARIALWGAIAACLGQVAHAAEPGTPVGTPTSDLVDPPVREQAAAAPSTALAPVIAPPTSPGAPGTSTASVDPVSALDLSAAAPLAPEPRVPLLERWWFWTAVAAVGISAFVIVAASSTAGPPQTELGNRVAF